MSPEERDLIEGLFERMRSAASQPRDAEAEALISRRVSEMPYAPYALAQTVLVQEHALRQASGRIDELEAQVRQQQAAPQQSGGSFLGGLFGGGNRGTSVPATGVRSAGGGMPLPAQSQNYAQQPGYPQQQPYQQAPSGPWGQQRGGFGGGGGGFGGGGFLQGAITTAAGVAGGMLLANGIRDLMSGGEGAIAKQAALEAPPAETPVSGDGLGAQAQDALGGNPAGDAGADPWSAAPQDASYDSGSDSGWDSGDSGGGDDSSWT